MAPAKTPKSTRGLVNRLTAKVGPLPVWAWAAAILGAYFLYSRMRPPAATTTADTSGASTPDGTTGAAPVPASGQGSPADNLSQPLLDSVNANTASIDALTSQILSMPQPYSEFGDAPPAGDFAFGSGPAAAPTATQPAPAPSPAPAQTMPANTGAGHLTQTAAGVLKWGGVTFTTKAQFDSWARAHGSTASRELAQHPQAKAIYSTLK